MEVYEECFGVIQVAEFWGGRFLRRTVRGGRIRLVRILLVENDADGYLREDGVVASSLLSGIRGFRWFVNDC